MNLLQMMMENQRTGGQQAENVTLDKNLEYFIFLLLLNVDFRVCS